MDLSIIIPTRNAMDPLSRLVESLERSVRPSLTWEVLVVDNGSESTTATAIQCFAKTETLPLRVMSVPVQGKCRALNSALQQVHSDFVAFLDHDVVVHEDYLVRLQETLGSQPHSVFGGRVLPVWPYPPEEWVTGGQPLVTSRGPIVVHDYGDQARPYEGEMRYPVGCNFICRRDLFERHGYFDTRLGPGSGKGHMGGEESELLRRFKAGGEQFFYAASVAVDHPVEPERMTKRYFRYRYFCAGRSIPYVMKGQYPTILGIPRYHYREVVAGLFGSITASCTLQPLRAFDAQLLLYENLGAMYEYWKLRRALKDIPE